MVIQKQGARENKLKHREPEIEPVYELNEKEWLSLTRTLATIAKYAEWLFYASIVIVLVMFSILWKISIIPPE